MELQQYPQRQQYSGHRQGFQRQQYPGRSDDNLKPESEKVDSDEDEGEDNEDEEDDDGENKLSENSAPRPVQEERSQPSHSSRRQNHGQNDDKDGEENLTSVAAPAPVQREDESHEWRRDDHLEEGEEEAKEEDSESKQATPNAKKLRLYTIAYLVFFSFWGTLARLGVQWLGFYPGAVVVISNLWANFGGSLFMGFLTEDRNLFDTSSSPTSFSKFFQRKSHFLARDDDPASNKKKKATGRLSKKEYPLFIGLTTGFCGSFTSFSTFSRDMFFALSNYVATPINHPTDHDKPGSYASRSAGWSVCDVLAVVILTLCVNLAALKLGAHIALGLEKVTPALPHRFLHHVVNPLMVFLAAGCWIGAILLAVFPPDRPGGPDAAGPTEKWRGEVLFALVFAPLGCLLRWYLSKKLNSRISGFPLGTFAANIFGVIVLAMCYDLQHVKANATAIGPIGGMIGCQVLQGVQDGFCGCLTTISTWILELTTLKRWHAYRYGGLSVFISLALMIVIMGSVRWSVGYVDSACVTETS